MHTHCADDEKFDPLKPIQVLNLNSKTAYPKYGSLPTMAFTRKVEPIRKVKKFVRCSKQKHSSLRTTTALNNKLEIIILKGQLPSDQLLYIKQHSQYQVRYNDRENDEVLLASIPKHYQMCFSFHSVAAFTQYIVNNKFIRFRNRGPTQTQHVSLWRIYQFEGEQTLFNVWCVKKAAEQSLKYGQETKGNGNSNGGGSQKKQLRVNQLSDDIMKHIFGFVSGPKFHCWIHLHEIIDRAHHRSNLVGLEFDSNTRNVYVLPRSPALLKKVRQIGDQSFTRKNGVIHVLTDSFFQNSVELFRAVYD